MCIPQKKSKMFLGSIEPSFAIKKKIFKRIHQLFVGPLEPRLAVKKKFSKGFIKVLFCQNMTHHR